MKTPEIRHPGKFCLRSLSVSDVAGIYETHIDAATQRYTRLQRQQNKVDILSWIQYYPHYQRHGFGLWTIEKIETKQFVGICGLRVRKDLQNQIDISYRIHPKFRNKGIATAAVIACLKFGFEDLLLESIIAQVHEDNAYSIQLMRKVGFVERGKEMEWILFEKRPQKNNG
jgi:[ribosomal protein S5]-alanine N-acetyltransferase